ncbi:SLC13 family permease [Colwellia sp. BRX9-1]|uniref:SLC13 family permease n=1 Tax=Colwellia sp. BRX9-1 TaxID=2759830 RepID=UPI0015F4A93F|nr:SLC13 family permease [Colwellia sp. BRX9-1]MBA6352542.1 SLC13 family permease [Colwellia sp. BRX9-1]
MNIDAAFVLLIFISTIIGLLKFQKQPGKVFGFTFIALIISGQVSNEAVLASMSNKGLITLILLILCSLALEKTRLLRILASKVLFSSYGKTWIRLFSLTVVSSALLNNTAVVSTMLAPIRNNPYHSASRLLLPLSYAAIFGGTLTLIGTSTNLIVNSLVLNADLPALGFFDFFPVGVFIVITCGCALWFLSKYLPETDINSTLESSYLLDAKVELNSALIGKTVEENALRHLDSLFLIEIIRAGQTITPVSPDQVISANDKLIFNGDVTKVNQLKQFDGLTVFAHKQGLSDDNLTEVFVRSESVLINKTLKGVGFRAKFDAAVVAMKRDGQAVTGKLGDVSIRPGDYLVLATGQDFKARNNVDKNFIVVNGVEPESKLTGKKEPFVIISFFLTVALSALGIISLFKGMLVLFSFFLLSNCLSKDEVIRRFPIQIWLIISTALMLASALINSGLLTSLETITSLSGSITPTVALIIIFLLTVLLTELVTNNAAAALIFPIAYSIALSYGVNITPFIMAVAFGASASFISPYGYQTNLMVFSAGQYQLIDFIKIGVPISVIYCTTAICSILYFFPF